jgi:hypothetical protein
MDKKQENMYFAAKPSEEAAEIFLKKADMWFKGLDTNGYLDKLRTMYSAYHGNYYESNDGSHKISFGGEQGELTNIAVNHLRNVARHMLQMVTSTRPSLQARATNTDYKSLVQTKLANGLLDYYMREKRLEEYVKIAVEYAIVFGSGYIKMEWNSTVGDVYDFNEELGIEEREGDVEFTNLSPFDVIFDINREDNKHDWVFVRSFKNRHDLAAKYPEHFDEIMSLPTKDKLETYYIDSMGLNDTELIPVYEVFHKRTESMPEGRYMMFLSSSAVCLDTPIPYRNLPIYRIAPANILGTPYGYTDLFDVLPLQDAVNSLYSTVLTNQSAFGVQNILVPKGADVSMSELSGGLNIIEANMQFGKIEPLNLTATPKEIFESIAMYERAIETISGINSVSRGNPDPNLRSGNALALVQSMSLQFISGLQQSYVFMLEDLGSGLINLLKDFASVPRIAMITGKSNRPYMKEFTGDDLSSVNRVIVDIGNPLARTTAGRVEMAEQMMQMGIIKNPADYLQIIDHGKIEVMTEDTQSQLYLVRSENERLVSNEEVVAVFTDDHRMHIQEHASVLSDPELRFDNELVARTDKHIREHMDLLRNTDPDILGMLGQQPLGPIGGSPAAPQQAQMPPDASMQGQAPDAMGGPTIDQQMGIQPPANLPNPAQAPVINGQPQPNSPEEMMMMNNGQ